MYKDKLWLALLVAVGLSFQNVYADDTRSAVQKTQDCLRNQNCDSANTDEGNKAVQKAWEAMGGNADNIQALYNIAADIMPILVQQSNDDPAKMNTILMKAQTDPEGFLNSLPRELQTKIKNVAKTIR